MSTYLNLFISFGHERKSKRFTYFKQPGAKDCGPTCLKMVARSHGKTIPLNRIREISETTRTGSNLLRMGEAAETLGLRSLGVRLALSKLEKAPLPCILHWNQNHYVVLYGVGKKGYAIADPAYGKLTYSKEEFLQRWIGPGANPETEEGIALLLEPTADFYHKEEDLEEQEYNLSFVRKYLFRYKPFLLQLIVGLLAGSLLQLVFPFLTQSVVDVGIQNRDLNFIYLILFAQLALFIGRTSVEVIRSWILLHLTTRINISLVSDFFIKLMRLPIAYFDSRMTGDILQRINDHQRIERIMTTSSLNVLFSLVNFIIFALVLAYYSLMIFGIFLIGSVLYFLWISVFLKKRAALDHKRFSQLGQEQSKVIELINGMQTIKLHNAERQKRWGWEHAQVRLFNVAMDGLALEQYQSVGSGFINELKNILITILSAKLVIDGELTLGMMLAISYIVGQLNSPVSQFINFIRELQDARISLERLAEIHNKEDEASAAQHQIHEINPNLGIHLNQVSFRYPGATQPVFQHLNLQIPSGKVTAIVGVSGSGKTTLMKMLLKFYDPDTGEIRLGRHSFAQVAQSAWRRHCGVVLQEDYIFNDTIANNIAVGADRIDKKRLAYAVEVANIQEYIEGLPLSYNTKIGMEGQGLSTGQKQRLLIARAVYKNPDYLFLDEATSALDANNEKSIMEKLNDFFKDRTVVVIAHRLSTVRNADQIIVLDQGRIVETGTHQELIENRANYFHLIKNQLELGR